MLKSMSKKVLGSFVANPFVCIISFFADIRNAIDVSKMSASFFYHAFISLLLVRTSRLLSSERAALGQTGLATGGLAEDCTAAGAYNNGLCVRVDSGDCEAAGAPRKL